MKTYLVGGAVRDEILGIEPKDRDYVVVGATPEYLESIGFKRVGADFPVFLHPVTGDEYALARVERSTGAGYGDFTVSTENVTIEEDLFRRDLTINSIAKDIETCEIIDPYNGVNDLKNGVIRHTSDAFIEDPLRVFRIGRFLARYPDFSISSHTYSLSREIVKSGALKTLTAERVGVETLKALSEKKPSQFFKFLQIIDGLDTWFPELAALIGQEQPEKHHAEGDAFVHTLMVLDESTSSDNLVFRWSALVHDLGKGLTPKEELPSHHGHERAGVPLVKSLGERLRLSNDFIRAGQRAAEFHTHVHKAYVLNAKTYVKLIDRFKGHFDDIIVVSSVAFYDGLGKIPKVHGYENSILFNAVLSHIKKVKASDVLSDEKIKEYQNEKRFDLIQNAVYRERVRKAEEALRTYK